MINKCYNHLLLFLLLLFLFTFPSCGGGTTGTSAPFEERALRGRVVSTNGASTANLSMEVVDPDSDETSGTSRTTRDGTFTMTTSARATSLILYVGGRAIDNEVFITPSRPTSELISLQIVRNDSLSIASLHEADLDISPECSSYRRTSPTTLTEQKGDTSLCRLTLTFPSTQISNRLSTRLIGKCNETPTLLKEATLVGSRETLVLSPRETQRCSDLAIIVFPELEPSQQIRISLN
jgi:hypothetical protein